MTRFTRRARYALGLAAVTAGAVMAASPAVAIDAPTVTLNPAGPTNGGVTVDFGATADPGDTVTGYQGGLVTDPNAEPTDAVASPSAFTPSEGTYYFRVRAVQAVGGPGPYNAAAPIVIDTTPPSLSVGLDRVANAAGWIGGPALNILRTCSADASCPPIPVTTQGTTPAQQFTVADAAGNVSAPAALGAFNFDSVIPTAGAPLTPSSLAVVPEEPVFEWTRGADATSGVAGYEVQVRIIDPNNDTPPITTIARVDAAASVGNYTARRQDAVSPDPLPEGNRIEWRVRTLDVAGNGSNSDWWSLRIDSTIPAAPTITGGPTGPSRDTSPTFTWTGNQQTFKWDVRRAGAETPVREGAGTATQTTLSSLPDGDYIFRVTQVTEAGRGSAEATRTFQVDTTPPDPPTILSRPTFPAITAPVFTWSAEPGAYSRWVVIGPTGAPVVGPVDTPVTSAELPPLADGAYSFQVQQIDAAGNVSAATGEPFTVLAPLTPAPAPSGSAGTVTALALPKQNATRLSPKAGAKVPTLVPVLRWSKGPRGTKLYNLQIFRVTQVKRAGASPKVTKIYSAFPKGRQLRAPKRKLKAGTCYVWRVWPYTGQAFTPKPVGVSNFCTASAKVIRLKAKQAAARAAKAKAARLRAR